MSNFEHVVEIQKVTLDCFLDLSNKVVEGTQKFRTLNMQLTRATLADMFELAQKSLSTKEPRDWITLQESFATPISERVQTYSRQAVDILLVAQAEFGRIAQVQGEAYGRQLQTMMEAVAKKAPTGAEPAMFALNSAISAANTLYDNLHKTSQQAVKAARSNLEAAAEASKSRRG
ncbi:TIGR01841 family phasin [Paraburkholderia caribensis]|uniref:TIGR01841 family phasin n=2 Tax=Paraburkholderia caribensis TaxID=75105 RepID=A0ABV0E769_9BURK|nr:TIGR01841 family phasin [Paraburkholderia caribensis]PTB24850.1 Phasin (PHA-granule associated protein) [Paraburkholderia caribensis]